MSVIFNNDPVTIAKVQTFVLAERSKCLSVREWKHRLAGYGYCVNDTDHGQVVATLPHGIEVCTLPQSLGTKFH